MKSSEMIQIETITHLEELRDMCSNRQGCFSCPFCRYEVETLMRDGFRPVAELCSLYDVFKTVPSGIKLDGIDALIKEGRK